MTTYETLFITSPELSEAEESDFVGSLAEVVTAGGGKLVARERMGRRRLAYPIKKFEDGVYTLFLYDAEAAVPRELERRVGLSDKVLRFLTVRLEREWASQAKEQAVKSAEARAQAEAEALKAAEAAAAAEAEKAAAESEAAEAGPTSDATGEESSDTTEAAPVKPTEES